MHIHKFAHSAVLLEEQEGSLLFDPGSFSFPEGGMQPGELDTVEAIFITHSHADHCDPKTIKTILASNPNAKIYTNQQIVALLQEQGIAAELFEQGTITVGGFTIEALPSPHESNLINNTIPPNIAYRVNQTVVHPGDSFSNALAPWQGAKVLLTPIVAPWQNEMQLYAFVKAMKPERSIPIHDGYIKDFFLQGRYQSYQDAFAAEGIEFIPLGAGMSVEIA